MAHSPKTHYTITLIHHSPLTATYSPLKTLDSRLTTHQSLLHHYTNPPLTTHGYRLTAHPSRLTTHDSKLTATYSPLKTLDSRLTTHQSPLHHYTNPPLIPPLGLIEFSIQISLFSKAKFTRTDINRKKFELSILKF